MSFDPAVSQLFVEGSSDGSVINELAAQRLSLNLGQPPNRIVKVGNDQNGGQGFDWVRGQLEVALANRKPLRSGIVVDRDGVDEKPDRWLSIRDLLRQSGIDAPDAPSAGGFITSPSWGGRVGVWLMPDNLVSGDLESLLEGLIPQTAGDWSWAEAATQRARTLGATVKPVHQRKARLHTWLAWQDPPGLPYGTALRATQLTASSPAVDAFVGWFEKLFIDP